MRAAFAGHELVLATPAAIEPLVRLAGVADRVYPAAGLAPLRWTGPAPEVAVNLHGRGPESHRLLQRLAPRRLLAFGCAQAGVQGPAWTEAEHEVERWCRLVTESTGVRADPADLALPTPGIDPAVDGAVVIHPGAAFASRRWPVDRFAQVAAWAASTGCPVVITGSGSERELAQRVAADAGGRVGVLAGETTLLELAALVASAQLVICGDTGVAHLATAFRTPSVVLFGPVPPGLWGPPDNGPHVALWDGGARGNPWGSTADPALLRISVDAVVGAATQLLSHCVSDPSGA